jgi:hypothetical protein
VLLQVADVRIPFQEPQQLINDRFEVHFLGSNERKAVIQVEPELSPEHGVCSNSGSIGPNKRTITLDALLWFSILKNIRY